MLRIAAAMLALGMSVSRGKPMSMQNVAHSSRREDGLAARCDCLRRRSVAMVGPMGANSGRG